MRVSVPQCQLSMEINTLLTQSTIVRVEQPIFPSIDVAAHRDGCSPPSSNTIRTPRALTSKLK